MSKGFYLAFFLLIVSCGGDLGPSQSEGVERQKFKALSAGYEHTCGLTESSEIICWGKIEDNFEQGLVSTKGSPRSLRLERKLSEPFHFLSSGSNHTCAVNPVGEGLCWGQNANFQLGESSHNESVHRVWIDEAVDGPSEPFVSLFGMSVDTCGLTVSSELWCWGMSLWWPERGMEAGKRKMERGEMQEGEVFTQVVGGLFYQCGMTNLGNAYCWGYRDFVLDEKDEERNFVPVAVDQRFLHHEERWISLFGSSYHLCGLTNRGQMYCWGSNKFGELGVGELSDSILLPLAVDQSALGEGEFFTGTAVGGSHSCGVTNRERIFCWGANHYGQLGTDSVMEHLNRPEKPVSTFYLRDSEDEGFVAVSARGNFTCGLTISGYAYCWGYNQNGELGDGTRTNRYAPRPVVLD